MKILKFTILVFAFQACTNYAQLDFIEATSFLEDEDNEVRVTRIEDSIQFELTYIPVEIIALQGSGSVEKYKDQYPSILSDYNELEYYKLVISSLKSSTRSHLMGQFTGLSDESDAYLDLLIQKDIYFLSNADTIRCAYMHKEVSESITNQLNYTIAFPFSAVTRKDRTIELKSQFMNFRNIRFVITENSIQSIPKIKI